MENATAEKKDTLLGKRPREDVEKDQQSTAQIEPPTKKKEDFEEVQQARTLGKPYFAKQGLRMVEPYTHTFSCHAKRRWIAQNLLEIYAKEFKAFSEEYYLKAIEHWKEEPKDGDEKKLFKGKITVNGKNVDREYDIKDGDKIVHETTREETPVINQWPSIIKESKSYLVVNKPSSMPVHACGNFKLNTLQCILENEMGFTNPPEDKASQDEANGAVDKVVSYKGAIKTVHRLDRQTSGIVFFAKTEKASDTFRKLMIDNKISKVYYARVLGDFSKCPGLEDGCVWVENLIYCVSNIEALWACADEGNIKFEYRHKAKPAKTKFKFKYYDEASNTSVIKCYPKTGRTHQIRVHLKHLGYPIANDQMYGKERKDLLMNNGDPKEFPEELFKNSYQNDQGDGKKTFLVLWLHAYKYTIPSRLCEDDATAGANEEEKDELKVKSTIPKWASSTFKIDALEKKKAPEAWQT